MHSGEQQSSFLRSAVSPASPTFVFLPPRRAPVRFLDGVTVTWSGTVRARARRMRSFHLWPFERTRRAESGASLTVLIADQDPYVRADLEQFVSRRGCHAFFAADGTVALRCLTMSRDRNRDFGRIDVVIADADLPGRSGIDLLLVVKNNGWDMEVVLTTESISTIFSAELERLGAAAVIPKPVSPLALEKALARIQLERQER
jgi:CheY-like chemotaxis protein